MIVKEMNGVAEMTVTPDLHHPFADLSRVIVEAEA